MDIAQPEYGVVPTDVIFPIAFYLIIIFACPFYIFYALFPKLINGKSKVQWNLLALGLIISIPLILLWLDNQAFIFSNYIKSLALILLPTLFGVLFRSFFMWIEQNNLRIQLEKLSFESELAQLRLQINPHFLFNTLNNIDSLIADQPKKASDLLLKLSDIMRYMLYEAGVSKVNLDKEVEYLENFVFLQKQRFKDKESINFSVVGKVGSIEIPPMLLIPFVENTFKHYSPVGENCGIDIRVQIGENKVKLCCQNSYDSNDSSKDKWSGIGLKTVKRRLGLIYKDDYGLKITRKDNTYTVNLTIPSYDN
ncbi:sensor histidine kinase [Flagellimonas algicola]|nr:histidine kinase [Allomuricauda algicola]